MGKLEITLDHGEIQNWVLKRRGIPAKVPAQSFDDLKIAFPGEMEKVKTITWEEFFKEFEHRMLAFEYEEKDKNGEQSHEYRFVGRSL